MEHPYFGPLAQVLRENQEREVVAFTERAEPAPFRIWGEAWKPGRLTRSSRRPGCRWRWPGAHARCPRRVRPADRGVLAADNAVIPYAVGVDIACRMRLSVYDIPASDFKRLNDQLIRTLRHETLFGTGQAFKKPVRARSDGGRLVGHAGDPPGAGKGPRPARHERSGNHFVEFGIFTLDHADSASSRANTWPC